MTDKHLQPNTPKSDSPLNPPSNSEGARESGVKQPVPPAIQRLLDEVKLGQANSSTYDRGHNRHNRS